MERKQAYSLSSVQGPFTPTQQLPQCVREYLPVDLNRWWPYVSVQTLRIHLPIAQDISMFVSLLADLQPTKPILLWPVGAPAAAKTQLKIYPVLFAHYAVLVCRYRYHHRLIFQIKQTNGVSSSLRSLNYYHELTTRKNVNCLLHGGRFHHTVPLLLYSSKVTRLHLMRCVFVSHSISWDTETLCFLSNVPARIRHTTHPTNTLLKDKDGSVLQSQPLSPRLAVPCSTSAPLAVTVIDNAPSARYPLRHRDRPTHKKNSCDHSRNFRDHNSNSLSAHSTRCSDSSAKKQTRPHCPPPLKTPVDDNPRFAVPPS